MKWQCIVVVVYAVFILLGGIMGYVKSHSHASLIAGSVTGVILLVSAIGIYNARTWGLILAFVVTSFLTFLFGYRYYNAQVLFPSGVMTILSAVTLLILSFLPKK